MLLCSRVHTRRPGAPSRTGSQAWAGKGPGRCLHLLAVGSVAFVFSLSLGRNVRHLTRSTDAAPACHLQADRAVCVLKRAGTAARCPPPPEAASAREPGTWGCAAGWAIGRARTSNKNRTAQARGRGAGPSGGRLECGGLSPLRHLGRALYPWVNIRKFFPRSCVQQGRGGMLCVHLVMVVKGIDEVPGGNASPRETGKSVRSAWCRVPVL